MCPRPPQQCSSSSGPVADPPGCGRHGGDVSGPRWPSLRSPGPSLHLPSPAQRQQMRSPQRALLLHLTEPHAVCLTSVAPAIAT